jgi:excisionase family DNA binding protein
MSIVDAIDETGQPNEPEFETKRQLAARLGVSVRTIDNLLARGLPHVKLTRKLRRFPRVAVNGWLAERQVCRR